MIIRDFHFFGYTVSKSETDAPLLINADTVLSLPVTGKYFKSVSRRDEKVIEISSLAKHSKFVERTLLNVLRQPPRTLLIPYLFRFCISKVFDHFGTIRLFTPRVNKNFYFNPR